MGVYIVAVVIYIYAFAMPPTVAMWDRASCELAVMSVGESSLSPRRCVVGVFAICFLVVFPGRRCVSTLVVGAAMGWSYILSGLQ